MPIEFGRCDRENKCGYFQFPEGTIVKPTEKSYTPPPPASYHSLSLVKSTEKNFKQNNFIIFLKAHFAIKNVKEVITRYLIGTSKHWAGATVFWQIDENEKVRHGKIMLYETRNGKRMKRKSGGAYITSVRSVLKIKNFNLEQCLFGLHLINENQVVALVESEKTAIIMSLFKPNYVWLATGSKGGFKYDYLKPLRNKKVVAFPDKSEFKEWFITAENLNTMGFEITVSDLLENSIYPPGTDLADIFIDNRKDFECKDSEISTYLNFQKKPIQRIRSNSEKIVDRWAKSNPAIWNLIDEFGLSDTNGLGINKINSNK